MLLFGLLTILLLDSVFAGPVEYAPIIKSKQGDIRGLVQEADDGVFVHLYQGIRYGRAERFAKPKSVDLWTDIYNATSMQFACVQGGFPISDKVEIRGGTGVHHSSEDCLYLNLWRPAAASGDPAGRTVMVFFYGGSFEGGNIFNMVYDARYLSSQGDVIVVTVNYRLGPFGFLYAGTDEAPGNMGLYDQILALRWVHENIAAFGGNPASVTIFGQSAGSMSVGALMLSPLTAGLIHRAIMQSGPVNSYFGSDPAAKALDKAKVLSEKLNCTREDAHEMVRCIKAKTAQEIEDNTHEAMANGESFVPAYGTELLPLKPSEALKSAHFNHVDLMYGVTRDEGTGFFAKSGILPMLNPKSDGHDLHPNTVKTIIKIMFQMFKEPYYEEVADFYTKDLNDSDKAGMRRTVSNAFSDYQLVCPTVFFGEAAAKSAPEQKYYSYRLNQATSIPVMGCTKETGVCHGMDIVYVFGILQRLRGIMFTEEEYNLSRDMIHAWTNFAKKGRPGFLGESGCGVPEEWTEAVNFNQTGREYTSPMGLEIDNFEMMPNYYKEVCNGFWKAKLFD